jgi:hypothetical protein
MTKRVYVDRSRYEDYQRCKRLRFHGYHDGPGGMGITSARKPLPLAVGGSVHVGLAVLLRDAQDAMNRLGCTAEELSRLTLWREIEDRAVAEALRDFAKYDLESEQPKPLTGEQSAL